MSVRHTRAGLREHERPYVDSSFTEQRIEALHVRRKVTVWDVVRLQLAIGATARDAADAEFLLGMLGLMPSFKTPAVSSGEGGTAGRAAS